MTDRAERKARYHTALRSIALNTTDEQSPGIRPAHLAVICCSTGDLSREELDTTLRAATQNGDVVTWRDRDGYKRVTLATEPDLVRLATHLAEELEDPDQLGKVNTRLQEVREDG